MLVSRFVKSFFLGAAFSVNILASGQRKNGPWSCRTKVFIIHSLPVDYQSPENEVLNATYPTNYYSPVTLIFWPTNLRHMFFSNNHAPWEAPGHGRVHGATSHPLSPKPGQGLTTNISPTNNMDVGPKIGLKLPPNHPFFSYGFSIIFHHPFWGVSLFLETPISSWWFQPILKNVSQPEVTKVTIQLNIMLETTNYSLSSWWLNQAIWKSVTVVKLDPFVQAGSSNIHFF